MKLEVVVVPVFDRTHGKHHWWNWYAPYLRARQNGSSPQEVGAAADRYMEDINR